MFRLNFDPFIGIHRLSFRSYILFVYLFFVNFILFFVVNVRPRVVHSCNFFLDYGLTLPGAMTTGTGVVASCTDAINYGAETCCTGSKTAKTG